MAKKHDNEFKVMIVELLKSGSKPKQVGEEYGLNPGMISRWKREFAARSGDFSKKKVLSVESQELKALKKELRNVTIERDILKKAVSSTAPPGSQLTLCPPRATYKISIYLKKQRYL